MSIMDNLAKAARTTHVQARGLNKPHRLATLTFFKATTLDTKQRSSTLRELEKLITLYLNSS